jgi:hypothetical protein
LAYIKHLVRTPQNGTRLLLHKKAATCFAGNPVGARRRLTLLPRRAFRPTNHVAQTEQKWDETLASRKDAILYRADRVHAEGGQVEPVLGPKFDKPRFLL